MARDWSREEDEAAVADYFTMLDSELRGAPYSKTEHRRHLSHLLESRSDGAIERKHQNVSAVLIDLGFPYIPGYKPLRNYQQILAHVVADRLRESSELVSLVEREIESPVAVSRVEDILSARVDPPVVTARHLRYPREVREVPVRRVGVNYLAIEARNRALGSAGEEFVVRYEEARLRSRGMDELAARVERVSATRGDGEGFDVLSFSEDGNERLIEVKTTAYGPMTPFFVTRNEVEVSGQYSEHYFLYRLFDFRRKAKLFSVQGSIGASFTLEPWQCRVAIRSRNDGTKPSNDELLKPLSHRRPRA